VLCLFKSSSPLQTGECRVLTSVNGSVEWRRRHQVGRERKSAVVLPEKSGFSFETDSMTPTRTRCPPSAPPCSKTGTWNAAETPEAHRSFAVALRSRTATWEVYSLLAYIRAKHIKFSPSMSSSPRPPPPPPPTTHALSACHPKHWQ